MGTYWTILNYVHKILIPVIGSLPNFGDFVRCRPLPYTPTSVHDILGQHVLGNWFVQILQRK